MLAALLFLALREERQSNPTVDKYYSMLCLDATQGLLIGSRCVWLGVPCFVVERGMLMVD